MNPSCASIGFRGLVATAMLAFIGLGSYVAAAAEPSAESRTVKFGDLDISTPSGARVLYGRIQAAAQVICSHYFFATDTAKARCIRDATADAVTTINQPELSAVYNASYRIWAPGGLVSLAR